MNLEMLQQKWNEMDSRLSQVETVNKTVVTDVIRLKTRDTLTTAMFRSILNTFIGVFVFIMVVPALKDSPISSLSLWTLMVTLILISMYSLAEVGIFAKCRITDSYSKLLNMTMQYKRLALFRPRFGSLLMCLVSVLVCYGESSWMIEKGVMLYGVLICSAVFVMGIISYFVDKKKCQKQIDEIEQSMKELKEVMD